MEIGGVNEGYVVDSIWSNKASWTVAWYRVDAEDEMVESIRPERLRDLSTYEKTAETVTETPVGPFSDSIELRRVRGARLMVETGVTKVRLKVIRHVLTAVVRDESAKFTLVSVLKSSFELLEKLKRLTL